MSYVINIQCDVTLEHNPTYKRVRKNAMHGAEGFADIVYAMPL